MRIMTDDTLKKLRLEMMMLFTKYADPDVSEGFAERALKVIENMGWAIAEVDYIAAIENNDAVFETSEQHLLSGYLDGLNKRGVDLENIQPPISRLLKEKVDNLEAWRKTIQLTRDQLVSIACLLGVTITDDYFDLQPEESSAFNGKDDFMAVVKWVRDMKNARQLN